jgi:hypothetical protein
MTLRKIIWSYQDFMRRRRLAKACPEHARLTAQRKEARRRHMNARDIERRQRAIMNGLLEG